jgi:hypothetical protein
LIISLGLRFASSQPTLLKSLERNILQFSGIKPTQETLIGMVDAKDASKRQEWLVKMEEMGRGGK